MGERAEFQVQSIPAWIRKLRRLSLEVMIWRYALPNILRVRTELQTVRQDAPGTDIDKLANRTDARIQ